MNAIDSGILAVLDYFNCKVNGRPFRSVCATATVSDQFHGSKDVLVIFNQTRGGAARKTR